MNQCAICEDCYDGIVVEEGLGTPMESESLSPLPPIEDIDIEAFVAAVGMIDGIAPYPFTHIMDISPAPNGALMYSFVGEPPWGYLM